MWLCDQSIITQITRTESIWFLCHVLRLLREKGKRATKQVLKTGITGRKRREQPQTTWQEMIIGDDKNMELEKDSWRKTEENI